MTQIAYRVEVSPRARYPRLKMSARDGLIVVVPRGFDESRIPALLDGRRDWIKRTEGRLSEQIKFIVPEPGGGPPERIMLRAIGEDWGIDYRPTDASTVTTVERQGRRLLVYGTVADDVATLEALRRWLSRKTREHIAPWLLRLASEHGFEVSGIDVRSQRTRWASCSSRKNISLNLRLMFLPEPLVRYAMLHELAHTEEMNHGRRFWATVQALEPAYDLRDEELRAAWRLVPEWIRPPANAVADCLESPSPFAVLDR
jgi:predicted metal-dependent hydrolase